MHHPNQYHPSQFVAHRGYAARYPENTLEAIEAAIAAGALFVEMDIQFSKDGIPVVYHDDTLSRTSGIPGSLFDHTASELLLLPAHEPKRFGPQFNGVKIPSGEALVALIARHPAVHFYVELKEESIHRFTADFCLRTLANLLAPVRQQCTLISFDTEAMGRAKREFDFPTIGIVFRNWAKRNELIEATAADIAYSNIERIPADAAITANCPVATYEIADPALAAATLERGAAKVETFAIGELIAALCRKA
jgi:glycerophosphoryl diester phosphodiesterase